MKLQLQSEASECGLACLAMVASSFGQQLDLMDLRRRFSVSLKGATLAQITAHADALGFSSRPLRLELEELNQLALPCILHWNLNHFVVLKKVSMTGKGSVTILDPAIGERRFSLSEVSEHFTGVALELTPNASFTPEKKPPRMKLSQLTGKVRGLGRSLGQIFAVALVLELFALTGPVLNQLVVDDAIATHDRDLLTVLLIGFLLLLVTQTAIGVARSWMIMVMGQRINLQWSGNLFTHLVKLRKSCIKRKPRW